MNVAVVGTGNVGSALLFHLVDVPGIERILVMNIQDEWSQASIMDVASAKPDAALKLEVASFSSLGEADVIALTSGAQMEVGQTGKDVLDANIRITKNILDSAVLKKDVIIIALATPVDDLTSFIQQNYQLPASHVMGFGGDLDKNRLRYVLSKRNIDNGDVQVIGEHGGRTIPVYSGRQEFEEIAENVRNFLGKITAQGGRPRNLATGLLFANLIDSIINDRQSVHNVCGFHQTYQMHITWPYRIGRQGVGEPEEIALEPMAQSWLDDLVSRKHEEIKSLNNYGK